MIFGRTGAIDQRWYTLNFLVYCICIHFLDITDIIRNAINNTKPPITKAHSQRPNPSLSSLPVGFIVGVSPFWQFLNLPQVFALDSTNSFRVPTPTSPPEK